MLAVTMFTNSGTFGAMRTEVNRRIKYRLLTYPDAVLYYRINGTTDRTMAADCTFYFEFAITDARRRGFGFPDHGERQLRGKRTRAGDHAGTSQKCPAIHRADGLVHLAR